MDRCELKRAVEKKIAIWENELKQLALDLWNHPEMAWHEQYAVKTLCNFLNTNGIRTAAGFCGFPTAFRGECGIPGGPVFAFAAEYDALPPGHACGHNLIAAASAGAMCAASAVLQEFNLPGRLVILGTPAEESGSGKVRLLEQGALDGVDAVMMSHPSWCTAPDTGSLAIRRYDVVFHGVSSHAAGSPELGVNALDAVVTLFNGVNAFRQQMPEFCRIHGVVTNGGAMPNIIPAEASCRFYLRSADEGWMEKLDRRFSQMVQGASLIAGTTFTQKKYSIDCRSRKPNGPLNESYLEMMTELGEEVPPYSDQCRESSDFGDFSRTVPGAHPYFGIADHRIGAHSPEFMQAAQSPRGLTSMLKSASALAYTACRFLDDPEFRKAVEQDFEAGKTPRT